MNNSGLGGTQAGLGGGAQQIGQWLPASTNVTIPIPEEIWAKFSNETKLSILRELGIIAKEKTE